jgi:hypothetical protein
MIETQKKSSVSSVFIDEYTEEVVEYNPPRNTKDKSNEIIIKNSRNKK